MTDALKARADSVVIVGASVAGVRCAQALRAQGLTGPITLIDRETVDPYDKPDLTKSFLTEGAAPRALLPEEEQHRLGLVLRRGESAQSVDLERSILHLEGESVPFDRLVLATGARARALPAFAGYTNAHSIRSLDDVEALRTSMGAAGRMVVIGGGFIGGEVASAARRRGMDVTIVESEERLMTRSMPGPVARFIEDRYRAMGVSLVFDSIVVGPAASEGDRIRSVALADGSELPADVVVIGIGSIPNTEWLASSGLAIAGGVACGLDLRVHGVDNVYAIGDVARWTDPESGVSHRAEHWTGAKEQASLCAANIVTDAPRDYATDGYIWSDQFDMHIQHVGLASPLSGESVTELRPDTGGVVFIQRDDDRIVGATGIDAQRAILEIRRDLKRAG